jgi:glyoxylase-like metal-dependent hydrolase (beta-lactamase superfamily II)
MPAPVLPIGIPNPLFEGDINLYAIAGEPLTLIDTGIGTEEALDALERGLLGHGLAIEDVGQVILTHKHADHIGLARTVRERSGATVFVHEDDWDGVVNLDARHGDFIPLVRGRLLEWGTPSAEVEALAGQMKGFHRLARPVDAERLIDGQRIPAGGFDLEVMHTPGHTQGSICLRYGRHLFTGDHVLPTISPNIGAGELRRSGMLLRYLESLDRVARLQAEDDDLIALPGHGPPFSNLAARVEQLKGHHIDREEAVLEILRRGGPMTVYDVASRLFGRLPSYHLMLGTAEAHAHLEKLEAEGRVVASGGKYRI